jgi:hypothetical protein
MNGSPRVRNSAVALAIRRMQDDVDGDGVMLGRLLAITLATWCVLWLCVIM